ncbi:MAG: formate C-acetyltransferase/glycerol dehydratase family glycyl radical enzyme [Oscillospiraceae bacterium]|nr:formate C-acetyltransferase/glycerol dehydratase family glycyl radical enzyme [Oscillospiraceae bacterium]
MAELLSFIPTNDICDFGRINIFQERMSARIPTICPERAELVTASFRHNVSDPIVVRRAKAFAETLDKMTVYIEPNSLIIGNQASANFAAPIFPEYSFDWVISELDEFEHRSGDYFKITEDTKSRLRQLESYWVGKTHKDEVFKNLSYDIKSAVSLSVLHFGGISMSGDGHIIPNHEFVLQVGFGNIANIAREKLQQDDLTQEQRDFYNATVIAMEGALRYCKRLGLCAAEDAAHENDARRKTELLELSAIFKNILEGKCKSFREAVQSVYLIHLLMMIESNGHSFSFGRFDQFVLPYYEKDLQEGIITKESALELIAHFFIMLNSLNKVRPWGHTQFSGGYPLYSALTIGGMLPDGTDGTNDLSYLCLEAMSLSKLPEPNLCVRFWEQTPHDFILNSARLIRKGFGMPSVFCDEVCVESLTTLDIELEEARNYASMGCVEIAIPGKWGHRATGMTYINFARVFELCLHNSHAFQQKQDISNVLAKLNSHDKINSEYNDYDELWQAWKLALSYFLELAVKCDSICDRSLKYHDADAFASSMIDCSLERGKTLKNGGAKYDFVSQSNIGMSVVGDSLAAVKKLVFEDEVLNLSELLEALKSNFDKHDGARIRRLCLNAPKFGNDDDFVDNIVADVFESYLELLPKYKNDRYGQGPIGCGYTMSTSNITSYVPNGFVVGATPDGRLAGKPLNEGASPCLGADREGPTAVINSVSKLPNSKIAGGQLLNMRFSPIALEGDDNLVRFANFIEAGRHKQIFHNQFNIIDSDTLRRAKENPHDYRDLMVRVAGYCALFSTLMPEAQDAIIARTEHDFS